MMILRLFSGYIIQLAPYAFLCLYPFHRHLRFSRRKSVLLTVFLILILASVFSLSGAHLASVLPANIALWQIVNGIFLCCLCFNFFWYLYTVKAIWQKKLFVFSFVVTGALAATSLYNSIVMNKNVYNDWMPYGGNFSIYYFIVELIAIPLLWLFLKFFYLPIEDDLDAKTSGYLSLLSLILSALLALVLSFVNYVWILSDPTSFFLFFVLLATVFVIYILFFKIYRLSREKSASRQKAMQIQHQNELFGEQYRKIFENMENLRKMRHDQLHHLLALQNLLDNGKIQKAREYLMQYLDDTRKYELIHFCGNSVVNMLVSHYYALAKEQDIGFTIRITIPDELPIQDTDLSVLLGNLLDNALSAAGKTTDSDRFVSLNMIYSGKMLAVTVDNGFDGKVNWNGERYLSTKQGHTGIGLKSLADIAEKYNGGAEFTHDKTEFHSAVMMGPK